MTKDLEETLAELGPGYRAVVDRVVGAYRPPTAGGGEGQGERSRSTVEFPRPLSTNNQQLTTNNFSSPGRMAGWSAAYLVAASVLVFLGLGIFFREPTVRGTSDSRLVYTVAYAPTETALAAILSSQRPDGSWDNDFITRQNAAALRNAEGAEMHVAYKKAVRYLKSRGLRPLSDDELKARSDEAARILATI